jgi:hypothetical protein
MGGRWAGRLWTLALKREPLAGRGTLSLVLSSLSYLSYLILSYHGAYVYVYRVSLFFYFLSSFSVLIIQYLHYCLFVKIVRNEYQDKFLICVNVFGNKPFLIPILSSGRVWKNAVNRWTVHVTGEHYM